ncbi:mannose-1-phosphate guanylyltransferase/mannose-1-phosphate guanylyltransferase/mannose-6-phosphate isomerase [Rhodobacter aestuarii]|uniref:mannose-1-phosphate guanylyltransferase n=1 Tax=Rhodobacter aestuarii TaxID=453582 RepID=A0A1N7MA28_9RHOB|nr:mannose-1-phosphate guanylyltransferase/mannose-6-phosphate isomerase [Rhodobacter aestuarii]PTV94949.1 mannose-1-phosphate guanylyltransferase/mannose-1-phosphate guanylyltransferase/mannose-6-phosphate isomerase [Rhodobacter aestuarii]SIS82965.1 mannose-1-phosphate guanylyltransferase/mannose-1-phosphate guanylyltransferase / mannose-6-phosphate isomerase [Rhodobacter aestuarii]
MIYPTILCGGSGTRLWPLSRKSYPKQFAPLLGDQTLFQASALRLRGDEFASPVVLTNSDFRFIVTEQLSEIGIDPGAILIEPEGRNTAPAVLAAALHLMATDPDAVLLVAPSDHAIPDAAAFRAAVERGLAAVAAGQIVTFGITPSRPETGYGYLELSAQPDTSGAPIALTRFVEKPDLARAEAMLAAGNFLWNAGIFLFRAADMVAAFEAYAPEVLAPVRAAVENAHTDLGFLRLDPTAWAKAPDISLDYAVMERATNLAAVPFSEEWSDLGGWDAVWAAQAQDEAGVATSSGATAIDCEESLLRSESDGVELVGIGLKNVIAVAMNDAVLVADMSRAQDVKKAVDALKVRKAPQAVQFPKDHRPWGWFETLALADRFQVKRIVVHPGAALSLQSHHHRSEHWIVVQGTAKVTIDDKVQLVTENQSVYIPLGAVHRMENPGKVPMVLIEVQTGSYLGEDDIIRYDDVYARGQGAKG